MSIERLKNGQLAAGANVLLTNVLTGVPAKSETFLIADVTVTNNNLDIRNLNSGVVAIGATLTAAKRSEANELPLDGSSGTQKLAKSTKVRIPPGHELVAEGDGLDYTLNWIEQTQREQG